MRISIGTMAVVALAVICLASPALSQEIQQAPLAPPEPRPPQLAQSPQLAPQPPAHLTTQDCVRLPDPVSQTDCLNQAASTGDYMPTPAPAPGSNMPMEFRLPLGKRPVPPP